MSKGINLATEGHIVTLYYPVDINGLAAAESPVVVCMKNYAHATIIVSIGADGGIAASTILVHAVDKQPTATAHAAIAFRYYRYETSQIAANGDVRGDLTWAVAATGIVPVATTTPCMYVIELDNDELPQGYYGFRLALGDPAAACVESAIAILTGPRYADRNLTELSLYT
jgi:hypothetical protein